LLGSTDGNVRPRGNDHVNLEANQLRCQMGQFVEIQLCKPSLDRDILTLDVAKLPQTLL
jgi:hypothetical protein